MLIAYEATLDLALWERTSPADGFTRGAQLAEKIGLVPILRAGLGMVDGFWELMPSPKYGISGCIATRKHSARWNTITSCRSAPRQRFASSSTRCWRPAARQCNVRDTQKVGCKTDQVRRPDRRPGGHRTPVTAHPDVPSTLQRLTIT